LIGAGLVTMGAQSSCSSNNGEGILEINDPGPGPGTGTHSGSTFSITLTLKDSSGRTTSRFARGELITFELEVLNRTNAPIHMALPTMGGNQDFQVYKPGTDDAEWEWLANKLFAAVVTYVDIPAGGTQVLTGTWDQVKLDGVMLEAGTHEAFGRFFPVNGQIPGLTDDDTQSPRVTFMVN
jgi:hypothetical protein